MFAMFQVHTCFPFSHFMKANCPPAPGIEGGAGGAGLRPQGTYVLWGQITDVGKETVLGGESDSGYVVGHCRPCGTWGHEFFPATKGT